MSDLIATEVQRLEQDQRVVLFELDARKFGDGILRFTPATVNSNTSVPGTTMNLDFVTETYEQQVTGMTVKFNGYEYTPLPIAAEGFEWSGSGTLPRPTLTLASPNLAFLSLVINADDLVGCPVKRIRTYRKYLDDGASPNPEATFPIDHYVIERKTSQKRNLLQFELSAKMDQQGKMIPARQVLRDACTHRFRYWANNQWNYDGVTCPYTGSAMFKKNGASTTDPTQARCGKRLSDCKLHFGETAVLPFYGFPGVGRL